VVPFLYFIAANNTAAMVRLHKIGARFDYELPRALGPKFPGNFGAVPSNPDVTMLKALLDAKLDPNFRPRGGWTLLFWTLSPFNRKAFDLLLHYGINAKEPLGGTVLHDAVYMQGFKLARVLIEHGANPAIRKANGVTVFDVLKRQKTRAKRGSPIEKDIDGLAKLPQ
jgi:ankyrin repeat protein